MHRTKIVCDSKTKTNFCLKIMVFSKKTSSLEISLRFLTFGPKIIVFSKKRRKKNRKGLHLGSASNFSNFVPKPWCSLLSYKIKVIMQKFVGHAKHDLHALTARHLLYQQLYLKFFKSYRFKSRKKIDNKTGCVL